MGGVVPHTRQAGRRGARGSELHAVTDRPALGHVTGQGRPRPLPTRLGDDHMQIREGLAHVMDECRQEHPKGPAVFPALDVLGRHAGGQNLGTPQMQGDVRRLQGMQQQAPGLGMVVGFRGRQQLGKSHEPADGLAIVPLEVGRCKTGLHANGGEEGTCVQMPFQILFGQDRHPARRDFCLLLLPGLRASRGEGHGHPCCQAGGTEQGGDCLHHCPLRPYRPGPADFAEKTLPKRCWGTRTVLAVRNGCGLVNTDS